MRPEKTPLLVLTLCAALASAAPSARADLLPEAPSEGLRVTVGVACDFADRWWEAALYPGASLPLEFRAEDFVGSRRREREAQVRIDPDERDALYALALAAFEEFRLDRRADFAGPGADAAWTGERTITLAAMTLDDELGRVDRVEIAVDVLRGRSLPPSTLELVERVADASRLARFDLDCN